jgi:hypothetical protein
MRSSREPARSASPTSAALHAGDFGDGGIGFGRVVDLELDQQAAQVALVARQRAVQQQRALGLVQLQQARQRVDVLLDQRGLLLQRMREPLAGDGQHRQQVLGLVLRVFVEVEEQRAFLVRAAPDAVPLQELGRGQLLVAAPELVVLAAAAQELAQALQRGRGHTRWRPASDSRPLRSRRTLNLRALLGGQRQHEVRAHQVQHRRVLQPRRGQHCCVRIAATNAWPIDLLGSTGTSGTLTITRFRYRWKKTLLETGVKCPPAPARDSRHNAAMIGIPKSAPPPAPAGQVLDTPCVESRTLSQLTGAQVFLKFENLQFTASFKERGACNKLAQLSETSATAASSP